VSVCTINCSLYLYLFLSQIKKIRLLGSLTGVLHLGSLAQDDSNCLKGELQKNEGNNFFNFRTHTITPYGRAALFYGDEVGGKNVVTPATCSQGVKGVLYRVSSNHRSLPIDFLPRIPMGCPPACPPEWVSSRGAKEMSYKGCLSGGVSSAIPVSYRVSSRGVLH
jgi:hypothetical protein